MDLSQKNIEDSPLAEVIGAVDQGLLWLDPDARVQGYNKAYRRLLDIEDERFIGRPYEELLQYLLARGEFFGAKHEPYLEERRRSLREREILSFERVRPNGTALSVSATPLSTGGYLYTYLDVSRERNVREILRRNAKATVVAMANFAEHRDTDTGVHVLRVARLVGQTGRKLLSHGKFSDIVDEEFIEHIATASILHDVGKISTPDRILLKSGPLTQEDREVMQRHTVTGAELLNQARLSIGHSEYLELGVQIARSHHEWFDGRGYPHGLSGNDIPLAGRICAVADVYDALTSRRPYKAPWDVQRAAALIREQSGTQFDPDVVDAFLDMLAEREAVRIVNWTDDFSVGNVLIDEQHKILIDTINQLASAESLNNRHCVAMIIDELASYAVFHFDYEERLMKSAGYPHLDEHRVIHQAFVDWVTNLREQVAIFGHLTLGEAVLNYLRDWLSHHILGEDQRYRPYTEKLA